MALQLARYTSVTTLNDVLLTESNAARIPLRGFSTSGLVTIPLLLHVLDVMHHNIESFV